MRIIAKPIRLTTIGILTALLSACTGLFDGVYDSPDKAPKLSNNQLVIDASDWHNWYYIDFDSLQMLAETGDSTALLYARTHFTPYPIPTDRDETIAGSQTGMYTYWFDVFGAGIVNNKKRDFMPTAIQPEPSQWSIAIHRNNVRTNGGAVLETNYTSMSQLPTSSAQFAGLTFKPDEWTTNVVWEDQSQMLNCLIGCQGINVNKTLSSWLKIEIPPMPPAFKHNNHVFVVKLKNGKFVALQLQNYINPTNGTKCVLTINYKYPY